jgi:PTS system mannitol-specific IIC component
MTPRNGYFAVILGVLVATVVSCVVAVPLLKIFGKDEDINTAKEKIKDMKLASKGLLNEKTNADVSNIKNIVFACDAGMGSSAMGATVLRKKLAAAGLGHINVVHSPVSSIPQDAEIVVTHAELGERAARSNPNAKLVLITNFLAAPEYDTLIEELKQLK